MNIAMSDAGFSAVVSNMQTMASQTRRTVSSADGGRAAKSAADAATRTATSHRAPKNSHRRPKRRKKHRILKWFLIVLGVLFAAGVGTFAYLYITIDIPGPEKMAMAEKTTVYYADGTTEIGSFAEQNREIIDCSVLPDYVGNAIVASENRTFWTDSGIDFKGIARALVNNITKGTRQGGSTITQQYAERYYMGETVTYTGKVKEAIMALKISQTQDKETVLCNYMNTIYLGRNAYGIQAAAQAYFGKDAKDLTLSEAATIAGIIPSPNNWDPAVDPDMAQERFDRVIGIMREDGYISRKEANEAQLPQTITQNTDNVYQGTEGYLLQMVRNELVESGAFTESDIDTGGYRIVTTIDKAKQDLMYQVATPTDASKGLPEGLEVGGISVNPKDGSIISIYAGEDYLTHQLNNATQATFEVGSTMKPFTLLATVEQGVNLNTTFNGNSPRSFPGLTTAMTNAGGVSYGYINLYQATANSVNTVFMDLQQHLGAQAIADTAHKAGVEGTISTEGDAAAYTTLGNDGLTVKSMAQGFSTIANQGKKPTLHIVSRVIDSQDQDLYNAPTSTEQVFNANDTGLVVKAMEGTIQYGTGKEARSIGLTMAGKSGTANDNKAASFVGFTPSVLTYFAIWYPGDDGSAQVIPSFGGYSHGSAYPAHMFTTYMSQALEGAEDEAFPDVSDDGKIGGSDGTWGTGRGSSSSSNSHRYQSTGNDSEDDEIEGDGQSDATHEDTDTTQPDTGTQDGGESAQPDTGTQDGESDVGADAGTGTGTESSPSPTPETGESSNGSTGATLP